MYLRLKTVLINFYLLLSTPIKETLIIISFLVFDEIKNMEISEHLLGNLSIVMFFLMNSD